MESARAAGVPRLARRLFDEPEAFDFFQAVRVLERLNPRRSPVGRKSRPEEEVVRFVAHLSLAFPPSQLCDLKLPPDEGPPIMTVAFMGLTGPQGVLPLHYTELLMCLDRGILPDLYTNPKLSVRPDRNVRGSERTALRDWLDLFNHRLISQFFRAWEKYRFYVPYERGEYRRTDPDPFTRCLLSFVGLEARPVRRQFNPEDISPLRHRLRVSTWSEEADALHARDLAQIDDLGLLHYSGFLAQRRRNGLALEALLGDFFQLPVTIKQFHGQWLYIEPANQSRMGVANDQLGVSVVAGEKVWDVQSKFRVRVGPLSYSAFLEYLPDRSPSPERKTFFLLCHLVRLYVGPGFDFDVQLILKAEDVPPCQLGEGGAPGPRLGWNTWLQSRAPDRDAEDVAFNGEDVVWLNGAPPHL